MIKCEVRVGNETVYYQVIGEGEPIILVHGLIGSTLWWNRNISALAEHYRVYLVDLPGFGTMSHFYYRFVLDEVASWLLFWMEAAGIKQANFVGHSMGGYICIWLAVHKPEVVRTLVLASPAGVLKTRSLLGYFIPLLQVFRIASPSFLPILVYDTIRAGPLTLLSAAQDLLAKDIREKLKLISSPTLLIWGINDVLVPPIFAKILHEEIANSNLLILKNAGHVVMYDQWQEFNKALLAFLGSQDLREDFKSSELIIHDIKSKTETNR
jgi:pimeloyl-ACP methyl ester carboxylesterase